MMDLAIYLLISQLCSDISHCLPKSAGCVKHYCLSFTCYFPRNKNTHVQKFHNCAECNKIAVA